MPASTPRRRWLTFAAVGGTAAAITLAGMPAATAAGDYLSFSTDGSGFSPTIGTAVFDQGIRLAPGGATDGSVWVRNDGDGAAYLSAGAVGTGMDRERDGLLSISGSADGAGGLPVFLDAGGTCVDVYQGWELGPGEAVRVRLTAALSQDASNAARNRRAGFDLVFLLQSADLPGAGRSACGALGDVDGTTPQDPGTPGGNVGKDSGSGNGGSGTNRLTVRAPAAGAGAGQETAPVLFQAVPGAAALAGFPAAPAEPGTPDTAFNTGLPPEREPIAAMPAGFQSTVEPIIRSLSGTLLIVMSVAFCAAAGIRLQSRSR